MSNRSQVRVEEVENSTTFKAGEKSVTLAGSLEEQEEEKIILALDVLRRNAHLVGFDPFAAAKEVLSGRRSV